jgi:uncharacterized protein (TIGR02186 family)
VSARRAARSFAAAAWVLAVAAAPASASPVPVSVQVSQPVIWITPTYEGELVKVRGTAPSGSDVVVKLTSDLETVDCSRKGKVGPFWLSVGRVRFDGVPKMYKIRSRAPVDDIVSEADQLKYVLGRRGLKASLHVHSGDNRELYTDELVLIRERQRLFSFREGDIERHGEEFQTTLFWPANGPPGKYRVEAFAVRSGHVVGSAETSVEVRPTGVEAWVGHLARAHGIAYGLFAVGLAVAAGLGASLAFKRRPRHRPTGGGGASVPSPGAE